MKTSVVTIKGQIVIPAELRKKIGIRKGTRVYLEEKNGSILVHPATYAFYEKTYGILKGGELVKSLAELRRQEKEYEKSKFEKR